MGEILKHFLTLSAIISQRVPLVVNMQLHDCLKPIVMCGRYVLPKNPKTNDEIFVKGFESLTSSVLSLFKQPLPAYFHKKS